MALNLILSCLDSTYLKFHIPIFYISCRTILYQLLMNNDCLVESILDSIIFHNMGLWQIPPYEINNGRNAGFAIDTMLNTISKKKRDYMTSL